VTFFNNLVNYDLTSFEEFTDQLQKSKFSSRCCSGRSRSRILVVIRYFFLNFQIYFVDSDRSHSNVWLQIYEENAQCNPVILLHLQSGCAFELLKLALFCVVKF
jgi:hypothetical protein